jgi:hypothetical protein
MQEELRVKTCSQGAVLMNKSKDGLAWNQDNVCEWGDMSIHGLFFQ